MDSTGKQHAWHTAQHVVHQVQGRPWRQSTKTAAGSVLLLSIKGAHHEAANVDNTLPLLLQRALMALPRLQQRHRRQDQEAECHVA